MIICGICQDEQAIEGIVPNSQDATGNRLDQYVVSVDDIENAPSEKIAVADYAKHDKLNSSWQLPIGCDEG